MRKICFVTGSRADVALVSGSLRPLVDQFEISLIKIGDHQLDAELDFYMDLEIEWSKAGPPTDSVAFKKAHENIRNQSTDHFTQVRTDLVFVCGDRWETHAAAAAAQDTQIKLAHLAGGDVTLGSYDQKFRDEISSWADLHFVTNVSALDNLKRMGISEQKIFNVGSPSLDDIHSESIKPAQDLLKALGVTEKKYFVVNYQPETAEFSLSSLNTLVDALVDFSKAHALIWMLPNVDLYSQEIMDVLAQKLVDVKNITLLKSLDRSRYLQLLKNSSGLIGNSSGALYECPQIQIPGLNIGVRQKGREVPDCVTTVNYDRLPLDLQRWREQPPTSYLSVYGDGRSGARILQILRSYFSENTKLEAS